MLWSSIDRKKLKERWAELALDGHHLMGGHNNQQKVGVDSGRDVGEETGPGQNVCVGGCLFVPGGKLNKIKIKKRLGLRWPPTGQTQQPTKNTHTGCRR